MSSPFVRKCRCGHTRWDHGFNHTAGGTKCSWIVCGQRCTKFRRKRWWNSWDKWVR